MSRRTQREYKAYLERQEEALATRACVPADVRIDQHYSNLIKMGFSHEAIMKYAIIQTGEGEIFIAPMTAELYAAMQKMMMKGKEPKPKWYVKRKWSPDKNCWHPFPKELWTMQLMEWSVMLFESANNACLHATFDMMTTERKWLERKKLCGARADLNLLRELRSSRRTDSSENLPTTF